MKQWNYEFNGVDEYAIGEQVDPAVTHAWDISTGQGIGVAVIDSGVSYEQENLDNFGAFDMVGGSFERNEYRENFLEVELGEEIIGISNSGNEIKVTREIPIQDNNRGSHDRCGHGTRMAGIIAAPRGVDGNSVGIAYNCNLYNYRATHNPLILTNREKIAVGRALIEAANEDGINIVNMSIGQVPFAMSSAIELGIDIAFGAGKMIVCAAGTSVPFPNLVVYPASSDKTVAVTGIEVPVTPNSNQFILCNVCHGGEEVNYSIILQDNENNSRTTLAVTCDGDIPAYSSGTSSAAAMFSGIAALVWSDLGTDASRSDVLQLISDTATPPSSLGEGTFGQGYINALEALEN